jgi:hypothetical protein
MRARISKERAGQARAAEETASGGMRLGRVVAVNDERGILVEFPDGPGPIVARLAVAADKQRVERAIADREVAVLAFENGDRFRPLVIGLLPAPPSSAPRDAAPAPARAGREVIEADVDGRRVRIEGQDEIVFQCGKSSVTLRRNGKIVIRGTHVETLSEGTNRIKGGQVRIN